MNIPKTIQEIFWQNCVSNAEVFFKSLPETEPLTKRKIMETLFARFMYETIIDVVKSRAVADLTHWEQDIQDQTEIFRSLLLGLVDESFAAAFKALENDDSVIALERKDDYYCRLSSVHPDNFFAPVIEVILEVDYRWFTYLMAKKSSLDPNALALRAERLRRVNDQVLNEIQMVVDNIQRKYK